jgi:dihydroorotate dehydrogenase (fumarate)
MNLGTRYLGLKLDNPIVVGASPLSADLDTVRRLEDAGVAAIVMHSLFEEQVTREQLGTILEMELHAESNAEALSYFPKPADFRLGPEAYLDQIRKLKAAVRIPVVASLNGTTPSGWLDFARLIQEAGADALELNAYHLAMRPGESGETVERRIFDVARTVKQSIDIPVAVKLSPFFSSIRNFAERLDKAGIDGLVLFNRFYQPDIDVEALQVVPTLRLSDSSELLLRLRWIAVLHENVAGSLVASGGVHDPVDAVKAIMCGADAVQVVSALLDRGPGYAKTLRDGIAEWMERHEYDSVARMRGAMSLKRSPNPQAFERANYMRVLQGWRA